MTDITQKGNDGWQIMDIPITNFDAFNHTKQEYRKMLDYWNNMKQCPKCKDKVVNIYMENIFDYVMYKFQCEGCGNHTLFSIGL